jgi:hypothetical protein
MIDRDDEFDAITEAEIWEEARDRLKIASDAEDANRNKAKEAIRFDWGTQWGTDPAVTTASMDEPELTINLTSMLTRRVVNNMKQQRPRGKCHPVGDGALIEVAETINGIGRHVEYRSEAGVAYDTAGDLAVKAGWGYCRVVIEYVAADSFQRDIRILPIFNIFTVYLDPSAVMPTACDMGWGFVTTKMRRTEYKRLYPRAENADWADSNRDRSRSDWESKTHIRLAEYFRIREKAEKLYLLRDALGNENALFKSDMPSDEAMRKAQLTIVADRDSSRKQVEWFRLNGSKLIDREILPGEYIPIIRCAGNMADLDGEVLRKGMVQDLMDPARMVNYGEVAKIKRLGLTPKAPWIAAEGQLDGHPEWETANRIAHPALIYKPVTITTSQGEIPLPPPQRQQPAQLEAGFAEFTEGMRSNLLGVAGMQNDPGQDQRGQVVSGIAQQRRDKTSDQAHFQYYDNQTLMIAQVWRIILQYAPVVYIEPGRMQRLIGEDGVPKMAQLNAVDPNDPEKKIKNDVSVGRYDVVMDTGPGYETKREEGSETLVNLLQVGPLAELIAKIGADLVFRSLDHPYMQELADRIQAMTPEGLKQIMEQLPARAKAVVQSLANENAQLKQQLQAAQTGITKAHLDATVKAHDVEETNKTKREDTASRERTALAIEVMRSHTTLAKEEIAAGGKILDTHAQAGHDAAAAERMIKAGERAETNGSGQ